MKKFCRLESGRAVRWINRDAPRERRRAAEQFLVEIVAPPPDRLTDGDRRRNEVCQMQQRDPPPSCKPPQRGGAEQQSAMDRQPAVPYLNDFCRVFSVICRFVEYMIDASADESHNEHGEKNRQCRIAGPPASFCKKTKRQKSAQGAERKCEAVPPKDKGADRGK